MLKCLVEGSVGERGKESRFWAQHGEDNSHEWHCEKVPFEEVCCDGACDVYSALPSLLVYRNCVVQYLSVIVRVQLCMYMSRHVCLYLFRMNTCFSTFYSAGSGYHKLIPTIYIYVCMYI